MGTSATVIKFGNSAAVVLPARWRKANGIEIGDKLQVNESVPGRLTFITGPRASRRAALQDLDVLLSSLPRREWEGGDSPDDDRRMIAERYE